MKQTHGHSRYLATILISTTMMVTGLDINKTGLQTKVSAKVSKETTVSNMGNIPAYFEENKGQFNEKVKYFIRGTNGYSLFLTATDAVYVLSGKEQKTERKESTIETLSNPKAEFETLKPSKAVAVYMTLAGANQNSEFSGSQLLEHRTNYFKGSDESKWHADVPNYQSVRTNQVYEGIDVIWQGSEKGGIQYDFVVQPNANPNLIEWKIQGAKAVELTADGDLVIKTEYGEIKQNKPSAYQETNGLREVIESGYIVEKVKGGNDGLQNSFRVKFYVGDYISGNPLIIDPTVNLSDLAYSTFLGGGTWDSGNAMALDGAGNVYVTGNTISTGFPTTPGSFDTTLSRTDVFVTKLNPSGSALIYSTFIGGSFIATGTGNEYGLGIAVDSSGNAFVTGQTNSVDYPTTAGAFDRTHNLNADVFVTKLNAMGSALIYSTYIGGNGDDEGLDIAIDSLGNAFLTGTTSDAAIHYPTTVEAFDTTHSGNGRREAFATKLNAAGSALVYSTFIGGTDHDDGYGIAVDPAGNAFVTGYTFDGAIDYPTTEGAFDTSHNGESDVFVTKLNTTGSALTYSTLIGGNSFDFGLDIVVDPFGNAFITGETQVATTDYPTTVGALDTSHNGARDAFVTKLNFMGSALIYSTFIGGDGADGGYGIAVETPGNALLTGLTGSPNYPTTSGAFDTSHNGDWDVIVTKLDATGSALIYSTFIGGSGQELGWGIDVDRSGNVFLAGRTWDATTDYPITTGAFDTSHNGDRDAFVTKLGTNVNSPAKFDFDGDGKTDIGIFRPGPGEWWYQRSSDNQVPALQFGAGTDRIAPADFTGDGKTDIAFWRPSSGQWFVLRSEDNSFFAFPFGTTGDVPTPADYDGDGKADAAVFRPSDSVWYILRSGDGGVTIQQFGVAGDVPVTADYDGDGKSDIAIFRPGPGEWWINRSTLGLAALQFGASTDRAVPGDFTGDGKADVAFWRPSTGFWNILRSEDFSFFAFPFGASGDVPVAGDYDGDGRTDAAVFRPSSATWFANRSTAGVSIQQFGLSTDLPVPNAFVP